MFIFIFLQHRWEGYSKAAVSELVDVVVNEEVDGNDLWYKYIERDSICTCSLCALKYVICR